MTSRTFTNWLGNSARSLLSNTALSLSSSGCVDLIVGGSAYTGREPYPVVRCPRLYRHSCTSPEHCQYRWKFVFRDLNKTAIGWTCVMTTMPVVPEARTILPGSISRRPATPLIGDRFSA